MNFQGGLNAYHKHKEPSEEMLEIWSKKKELIKRILELKEVESLETKTPEELESILDKLINYNKGL